MDEIIASICEGGVEHAIMDIGLEHNAIKTYYQK